MESKAALQYFSHVRRDLVCPAVSRDQLLFQAQNLMTEFEQENPGAQYSDFVSAFGKPEDFVGEILSCMDSEKVAAVQQRRGHIKRAILAGVALVLIFSSAFFFVQWFRSQEVIKGDFGVIEGTPHEIAEEEFYAMFEQENVSISEKGT